MAEIEAGVRTARPERFLLARRRLGLDQEQVGQFLGVAGKTVCAWECREDDAAISKQVCLALASAGVSQGWIEDGIGEWLKPGFTQDQVRESILQAAKEVTK